MLEEEIQSNRQKREALFIYNRRPGAAPQAVAIAAGGMAMAGLHRGIGAAC